MYQVTLQISSTEVKTITGLFGLPSDELEAEEVGKMALKNAIRDEMLKTHLITVTGIVLAVKKLEIGFWYSPNRYPRIGIENERFKWWLEKNFADRDDIDKTTLREIFDAMDDEDK